MGSSLALSTLDNLLQSTPKSKMVNFQSMTVVAAKANPKREELPAKYRTVTNERLMFCREVWDLIQNGTKQENAVNIIATQAEMYPTLIRAGKHGKTALTIFNYRNWMKRLGKTKSKTPDWKNISALSNRYSMDVRGAQGAPEFWKSFNAFYLNENKLSISKSYNMANKLCLSHDIAPIPSERQVRYWLTSHADQAAVMAARHGETWAEDHVMSYIRRDWSAVTPNECWIGDHHIFDAPVKIWNEKEEKWEATRPWLTGWMDAKTLRFTGVHIGVDNPSSKQILIALQNGIRLNDNVAPKMLYNDNGKDYLKYGFTEDFIPKDSEHKHSIAAELGMKCINSLPYNARAKTIERMFGEVCTGFSKIWGAYLGNRPSARPEISGYYWKNPEHLPSVAEFCEAFSTWLHEDFHAKTQNGKILAGKSPNEAWKRGVGGMHFNDQDLWFAMLLPYTRSTPKVARGAAIVLNKKEYRADALWEYFGKKIMIKEDVVNGGSPQAFTLDGQHICALQPVNTISALATSEKDRKLIGTEMKRQRRELKRAFGIADDMSNGMRKIAPQELMLLSPTEDVHITKFTSNNKSVKGSTHNFILHSIKPKELADETPTRELTKGEEEAKQLQEFGEVTQKEETEPEVSNEAMAEFHKHVINKTNRNKNDNYTPEDDMWN